MAQVYAFMAPGLEEVECLGAVDVMIRAGIEVNLVSITDSLEVTGAHHITVKADCRLEDVDWDEAQALFLPGRMPGTTNLASCEELCAHLKEAYDQGKHLAAICAAPSVLGKLGLLEGKKAVCFPGFEGELTGASIQECGMITDGQITTARGLGYALDLGLELVRILKNRETSKRIKAAIQYDQF